MVWQSCGTLPHMGHICILYRTSKSEFSLSSFLSSPNSLPSKSLCLCLVGPASCGPIPVQRVLMLEVTVSLSVWSWLLFVLALLVLWGSGPLFCPGWWIYLLGSGSLIPLVGEWCSWGIIFARNYVNKVCASGLCHVIHFVYFLPHSTAIGRTVLYCSIHNKSSNIICFKSMTWTSPKQPVESPACKI